MIFVKDDKKRKYFEKQALSHLKPLYFFALKLTGHREDAEDLVQESYQKAYSRLDQLRDLKKWKPWLYSIMVNTWKNWRVRKGREFTPDTLEEWESSLDQYAYGNPQCKQTDPETDLLGKEVRGIIESALVQLHPDYRIAVILSDIEGFSYKEISEMLEWPIGTVMSRLSRARALLRKSLIKYKEGRRVPGGTPKSE
jgi:RNA polymerase sigma-70 factor (ECF subfamily)